MIKNKMKNENSAAKDLFNKYLNEIGQTLTKEIDQPTNPQ